MGLSKAFRAAERGEDEGILLIGKCVSYLDTKAGDTKMGKGLSQAGQGGYCMSSSLCSMTGCKNGTETGGGGGAAVFLF